MMGTESSAQADLSFEDRVVIVTGAGGGLGRAYSLAFSSAGAAVVVNDIGVTLSGATSDEDPATEVLRAIIGSGGRAVVDRSDVSTLAGANTLVDRALNEFGKVDAVVCNAGIVRRAPFMETDADTLDAHLNVHLKGTFYVCRAAWGPMADRGFGRIVTVVSSALFGIDGVSAYSAAKGGVAALTRSLAIEGEPHGIKVNGVAPVAYTRMTAAGRAGQDPSLASDPRLAPGRIAPVVSLLAHELCPTNGEIFQASGAHVSRVFWGETSGVGMDEVPTSGALLSQWDAVMDTTNFQVPLPRAEGDTTRANASVPPLPDAGQNGRRTGRKAADDR